MSTAAENSKRVGQTENSKMPRVLKEFCDKMRATRGIVEFIHSNAENISSVERAFVDEAEFAFPNIGKHQHEAAAELIHKSIHRSMKAIRQLPSERRNSPEADRLKSDSMNQMRSDLKELTGDDKWFFLYSSVWTHANVSTQGLSKIFESLLMGLVSDFEVLVAHFVRILLDAKPEVLYSSERKFNFKEIHQFSSIEEFTDYVAEKAADNILRGGLGSWIEWLNKTAKIDAQTVAESRELFEIFQRRHLLVHNGGLVNGAYLSSIPEAETKYKPGARLPVGREYLNKAFSVVHTAGLVIAVAAMHRMAENDDETIAICKLTENLSYDLLKRREYAVVSEFNRWYFSRIPKSSIRLRFEVNAWLSEKKLKGLEAIRDKVQVWDVSSLANEYRLARHALLDELEEGYALALRMRQTGELPELSWMSWPVLEELRQYALVREGDETLAPSSLYSEAHSDSPSGIDDMS